jgi:hypothetical protein
MLQPALPPRPVQRLVHADEEGFARQVTAVYTPRRRDWFAITAAPP